MDTDDSLTLARIKLAELGRQRDQLGARYDAIERRAAGARSPDERLRALRDGLAEIRFARRPLHADAGNLDVPFFAAEAGAPSEELVADCLRRLERELAQGRLRAEFAYLFGRLLEEWASPSEDGAGPGAGGHPAVPPEPESPD